MFICSVKELGLKDLMPAYLDQSLDDNELLTGVSFASGGTGYDPETPKIAVLCIYNFVKPLACFYECTY